MTREEAIQDLKDILEEATSDEDAVCYVTSEDADALNMAIESLQGDMYCPNCGVRLVQEDEYLEPTQTHGRLIDADALVRSIRLDISITGKKNAETVVNVLNEIMAKIACAPTVQADRPPGEWIFEETDEHKRTYCSVCGVSAPFVCVSEDFYGRRLHGETRKTKFCPNCGSRMRGEEE